VLPFEKEMNGPAEMNEMAWHSQWIWLADHVDDVNVYVYLRRSFDLKDGVRSAQLHCTCSGEYLVYVNGRFVGRGPGPCNPTHQYYDTHDVAGLLATGTNTIACVAYGYGRRTLSREKVPGAFLAQLEIDCADGRTETIVSDESWKAAPARPWKQDTAQLVWYVGFQEVYDKRKEPRGWRSRDFDDSAWEQACVLGTVPMAPFEHLTPRPIPFLTTRNVYPQEVLGVHRIPAREAFDGTDAAPQMAREGERMPLLAGMAESVEALLDATDKSAQFQVFEHPDDTFSDEDYVCLKLDYGREVVGYPFVEVEDAGDGTIIDLGYSEGLSAGGEVEPTRQGILHADRLILTEGTQKWQAFQRRAFRYQQLTIRGCKTPLRLKSVGLSLVGYDFKEEGEFSSSDETLNRMWETGKATQKITWQHHIEDCPLREQSQYVGDVRLNIAVGFYNFADTRLARKALLQFAQGQTQDGLFQTIAPTGSREHYLPDYWCLWVIALSDYYLYTGDLTLLEEVYPNVKALMKALAGFESSAGLLEGMEERGFTIFVDHANIDRRGENTALNCFYHGAFRDAARAAAWVGDESMHKAWGAKAARVKAAINGCLWLDAEGLYADCRKDGRLSAHLSCHGNYLAVLSGIADADRSARILSRLREDRTIEAPGSGYFNFFMLKALCKAGHRSEALARTRSYWGYMLERGATTWWEHVPVEGARMPETHWARCDLKNSINGVCPHSLCHGYSTAPNYILSAEILGVKPAAPGYQKFVLAPHLENLDWAEGKVPTPLGFIDARIERDKEKPARLRINLTAPPQCTAHVHVPKHVEELVLNGKPLSGEQLAGGVETEGMSISYEPAGA